MADNSPSPLMNLPIPNVGQSQGPQYAIDVDNCFTIVDSHNHSPGFGAQITPNGLNINADLPINNNNLLTVRTVRFSPQSAVLSSPSDIGCLYEVVNDLFYNDGLGNQVRITQSGGVAGSPGSIANLTSPASAQYSAGTSTFIWQSGANIPANMDNGSVIIRDITAGSNGVTIAAPTALAADYTLTLPAALPSATSFLVVDTSGNISDSIPTVGNLTPSGAIIAYGGVNIPAGWLLCDGTSYLIATYSNLAAALFDSGQSLYLYGSANGTHFNVPDLRGMFLRGNSFGGTNDPDAGSRTTNNPGGSSSGSAPGSQQGFATQDHSHSFSVCNQNGFPGAFNASSNNSGVTGTYGTSGMNSGSISTETRPINVYVNYIIKI